MPSGWEGNRRSGVALAMRHRLKWFIYLLAQGLRKGDGHPTYTSHGIAYFTLTTTSHLNALNHECFCIRRTFYSVAFWHTDLNFGLTLVGTRSCESAHRGKWGQLTPGKMDEKLKSENMQNRAVFYVYIIFWEQSWQAGVCWLHIYSDILQNVPFCSQIFKIFFASCGKVALTPLTKILRTFLHTLKLSCEIIIGWTVGNNVSGRNKVEHILLTNTVQRIGYVNTATQSLHYSRKLLKHAVASISLSLISSIEQIASSSCQFSSIIIVSTIFFPVLTFRTPGILCVVFFSSLFLFCYVVGLRG